MRLLDAAGINYEAGEYEVDEDDLSGSHAADMMGMDHDTMFKTLVLKGDKNGYLVCCIPVDEELDLKKVAKASKDKKVEMIHMKELLPLTGYMRNVGFYPCLGKTPRFFCFGDNGKCYVANEDSDTIIEFDFDNMTGALIPTLNIVHTGSPVCILFAD